MPNPFTKENGQVRVAEAGPVVNAWEEPSTNAFADVPAANSDPVYPSPAAGSATHFDEKTEQPSTTDAPHDEKTTDEHLRVSPISTPPSSPITTTPSLLKVDVGEDPPHRLPNKARICLRVWQLLASVGAFSFQVGATQYSGQPMPFRDSAGLLYYVYAIDWVSAFWTLFTIYVYLTRRYGSGGKVKRAVSFLMDALLAALFGVGTFFEFALYQCPPGQYNGWCDFLNAGLFFLLSLFISYGIQALWDIFGGMSCLRNRN